MTCSKSFSRNCLSDHFRILIVSRIEEQFNQIAVSLPWSVFVAFSEIFHCLGCVCSWRTWGQRYSYNFPSLSELPFLSLLWSFNHVGHSTKQTWGSSQSRGHHEVSIYWFRQIAEVGLWFVANSFLKLGLLLQEWIREVWVWASAIRLRVKIEIDCRRISSQLWPTITVFFRSQLCLHFWKWGSFRQWYGQWFSGISLNLLWSIFIPKADLSQHFWECEGTFDSSTSDQSPAFQPSTRVIASHPIELAS